MPSRRPRRAPRRRSSPDHTALVCVLAGLALVGAMGVTVLSRKARSTERVRPVPPAPATTAPAAPAPTARVVVAERPPHPLDPLTRTVTEVGKRMPALRRMERGPAFERARVAAVAELSDAREKLGTYLDAHPDDDRGHRLWDKLLVMYVALKKL